MSYFVLLPILFPILSGIFLLVRKEMKNRQSLLITVGAALVITTVLAITAMLTVRDEIFLVFNLTRTLPVLFKIEIGRAHV